jgi:hypothetical protein
MRQRENALSGNMQPAPSMQDVQAILPAWLRPGAFGLVTGLHLMFLLGMPWGPATKIVVPPPVEIQVILPAEPARLLPPPDAAPAVEIKPAVTLKVDTPAAEAQPLTHGKDLAEVKPSQPAFATNVPPPAPPSRPQQLAELKPLEMPRPVAPARPAREVFGAKEALRVAKGEAPLPPSQGAAEMKPIGVGRPAVAADTARPAPEAPAAKAPALSAAQGEVPLPPSQSTAQIKPLDATRTAVAAEAAPPTPETPRDSTLVVDAPGQKLLPAGQRVAESIPLEASRPATPAPDARPARELSAPVLPTDKSSQGAPLSPDQRVTELGPFAALQSIAPIGGGTSAREVTVPGSSASAHTPEPLPSVGRQTAELKPYSAITGAPLHDQGPVRPERMEKIVRYIEQYDGGSCFFVAPVELTEAKARLEGYGASPRPFEGLNSAFQHENGFEATIDVRLVAPPQCPAVTFLGRLRGVSAPHLRIDGVSLSRSAGDSLVGAVDGFGGWNIVLLLATDSGAVQNVSHLLKPGTDARTFALGLADIGKASTGQPQLLIAVATSQPLDALRFDRPVAADRLFPAVLSEAARTNQAVAAMARYFKLEP